MQLLTMNMTFHKALPIILLCLVFVTIIVRKIGKFRIPIWLIMILAALIVIISGNISPRQAIKSISFNVLIYLFGVFVIGQALETSHYLEHLSVRVFSQAKNLRLLLLLIIVIFGFSSAFLMNDTLAIIGVPVVLFLARQHDFHAKPFLLALAYSITIGSVMSPIGNPQNLLIANSGISHPLLSFFKYLFIPTILNLILLYLLMLMYFNYDLNKSLFVGKSQKVVDSKLAFLSQISLCLLISLMLVKITLSCFNSQFDVKFYIIALVACAPILIFSKRRFLILRNLDWFTLVFFIGLFIFMKSVWLSNFFQTLFVKGNLITTQKGTIFSISVLFSQLISNVPLVALYLPFLEHGATSQYMSLAAGSTIAGNLSILGAASNVIIIQNTEKRGIRAFSAWDFFKLGLPLTICNVVVSAISGEI